MMQNEKLSHREVEVSRKSNQTKAKVVRCQHSEAPFQREFPVPEQFKTAWDGAKLITEPTEIMVSERPPKPLT